MQLENTLKLEICKTCTVIDDRLLHQQKKSPFKAVKEVLEQIAPATRAYLLVCAFCTLIHVTGLPAPELFSLDMSKLYEIWRPITSVAYFGAPSMSMANNIYFLVRYGQTLEGLNGTGAHAWFLFIQTLILTLLGFMFGFPFQASAMISATVYASSHLNPMEIMWESTIFQTLYADAISFLIVLLLIAESLCDNNAVLLVLVANHS